MQLNWSAGISIYMLIGGLIADYKVQKKLKNKEAMEKLYNDFPPVLVDMVYNRPLVFAMGCIVGLPGFLLGLKEKMIDKK
jgi:hypothetical protein